VAIDAIKDELARSRSGRRRPIALRCPCFAQALGDHPWSSVERMRSTHGPAGKTSCLSRSRQGRLYGGPANIFASRSVEHFCGTLIHHFIMLIMVLASLNVVQAVAFRVWAQ
jgi:hypothetical protein